MFAMYICYLEPRDGEQAVVDVSKPFVPPRRRKKTGRKT
jgi:hypothetical protein